MEIRKVAVLGCGVMGQGIARACALAGLPTTIFKVTPGDLDAVHKKFDARLAKEVENKKLKLLDQLIIEEKLGWSDKFADIRGCDLVIESIVEDYSAKQALFRLIEEPLSDRMILASNTSTLSIAYLAKDVVFPQRVIGLHFFNPVAAMNLVEVVRTAKTDMAVLRAAHEFVVKLGKTSVIVDDTPGFVVNRLMMNSLMYAISCLEDGVASMEDIDQAMKLGLGHPMGPFALCDYIGLDVVLAMARNLWSGTNEKRFAPPSSLRKLVGLGMLGKKTKKGFYDYTTNPVRPNPVLIPDTTIGE